MKNQGFANIIVIIGVVILVGIASYFIVNQKRSLPTPILSPTSSPTSTLTSTSIDKTANRKIQPSINLESIILKIPILDRKVPEDPFSELVIKGYTNKIVKIGEEFVIEASLMNRHFTDVKLELAEIKSDSVIVNVLADALNKNLPSKELFVPRDPIKREVISSGSCIGAFGPMDVVAEICFDFGKENGQIFLKYHLKTENTYPTP